MPSKTSNKTALVLNVKEASGMVSMKECIALLQEAYTDLVRRNAQVIARRRIHTLQGTAMELDERDLGAALDKEAQSLFDDSEESQGVRR